MSAYALVALFAGWSFATTPVISPADCSYPHTPVGDWQVQQLGASLGITVRLPVYLEEEFVADSTSYTWMGGISAVFAAQILTDKEDPLFEELPSPEGRPEYKRCDEQVGGVRIAMVTYNLDEDLLDIGVVEPFHVYAKIVLPDKSKLLFYGNSADKPTLNDFVAAVRTVSQTRAR